MELCELRFVYANEFNCLFGWHSLKPMIKFSGGLLRKNQIAFCFAVNSCIIIGGQNVLAIPSQDKSVEVKLAHEPIKTNTRAAKAVREKGTVAEDKSKARQTAETVNQVPGVKVDSKDLEAPVLPPIKGFHPLQKLLRPVESLGSTSVKLEQQLMKVTGPISALHPPIVSLDRKMNDVDSQVNGMQSQLALTQKEVKDVRGAIAGIRKDIQSLKSPLDGLQKPISDVRVPLERVIARLQFILAAILVGVIATIVGTPIAAVIVYRHRDKIFPGITGDMADHGLAPAKDGQKALDEEPEPKQDVAFSSVESTTSTAV